MAGIRPWIVRAYWAITFVLLAGAVLVAIQVPTETPKGPVQKLFYLHLPIAINTFMAASVVFIGCVAYLGSRRQAWDDLAYAAARVTVVNGAVLMLTGVFWAKVEWGQWWAWSPRLVFSFLLWLLYIGYVGMRPMFRSAQRGALVASVYGALAFLNVPLIYLSMKLLPDRHPASLPLTPDMQRALVLWFVAVTLLTGGLIGARFGLSRRSSPAQAPGPLLSGRIASQGRPA